MRHCLLCGRDTDQRVNRCPTCGGNVYVVEADAELERAAKWQAREDVVWNPSHVGRPSRRMLAERAAREEGWAA